jgi:hypothetical protein
MNDLFRQLYGYVTQWWGEFKDDEPIPADHKEAVKAYFEEAEGYDSDEHEWYTVDSHDLKEPSPMSPPIYDILDVVAGHIGRTGPINFMDHGTENILVVDANLTRKEFILTVDKAGDGNEESYEMHFRLKKVKRTRTDRE